MAKYRNDMPNEEWLLSVIEHVRADFATGKLYWKIPVSGRQMWRPLGSIDANGYVKTKINGRSCYAHQVIYFLFYKVWPQTLLDHDNKTRHDNRPENLVESNHSQNALNSKMWNTNTTGVKGVSRVMSGQFKVTVRGTFYGYFNSLQKAEEIANEAYQYC